MRKSQGTPVVELLADIAADLVLPLGLNNEIISKHRLEEKLSDVRLS